MYDAALPMPGEGVFVGHVPGYDSWWPALDEEPDARAGGIAAGAAGLPSQAFTFGTQHFSPDFLQAMRDPVLHFPSVFAHQY